MKVLTLCFATSFLVGSVTRAEVERFEITSREPFANGKEYGAAGAYERIIGKVHYTIDPAARQNRAIVDIDLASRSPDGKVRFSSDLFILAPLDRQRGNGAIFYDVNNRGNKVALSFFNFSGGNDPLTEQDGGDGFLMRQGFTIVWSGWDAEVLPGGNRMQLSAPFATERGADITGLIRCEMVPPGNVSRMVVNWENHGSYPPTPRGLATAVLTHRLRPHEPRMLVPRSDWKVHVSPVSGWAQSQLPMVELELTTGLQVGHIYELIYEGSHPIVHGVCFASVRDLMSALKHGTGAENPLLKEGRSGLRRAIGFGVSQSGRFLREFLYSGFNEDENGRRVFEGLIPHVSGSGLGSFNHRFAQPTRHSSQHDHHDYPPDRFPFTYGRSVDAATGKEDGILVQSERSATVPLIFHTQSTAEYWTRSGSLVQTDPQGTSDAVIPDNVRIYFFGGTQHGPGGFPPGSGAAQTLENPADYRPFLRSLLLTLDRWITEGKQPPSSVYPKIAEGTLVDWRSAGNEFPRIPGVTFPQIIQQPALLDWGPRWETQRIVDLQPPSQSSAYRVLVPKYGPDGTELGCLQPAEVAVPVASCTGWAIRRSDAGPGDQLISLRGSYIPFVLTKQERLASGDERLSIQERYGNLDDYLSKLSTVLHELHRKGFVLDEDIERTVRIQKERMAPLFDKIPAGTQ